MSASLSTTRTWAMFLDIFLPPAAKGSRKNNLAFCCCLPGLRILRKCGIGSCKPESQQPCGARRRTDICCVAAPRRCHHIACVASPCICPPGARTKTPTYFCANPNDELTASKLHRIMWYIRTKETHATEVYNIQGSLRLQG